MRNGQLTTAYLGIYYIVVIRDEVVETCFLVVNSHSPSLPPDPIAGCARPYILLHLTLLAGCQSILMTYIQK